MTPWPSKILLFFLRGYQLLFSSLMGRSCRYYPTCSSYTIQAVRRFGALRGALAGFCRILRCHPFHPGGYDPVPATWSLQAAMGRSSLDTGALAGRPHPLLAAPERELERTEGNGQPSGIDDGQGADRAAEPPPKSIDPADQADP